MDSKQLDEARARSSDDTSAQAPSSEGAAWVPPSEPEPSAQPAATAKFSVSATSCLIGVMAFFFAMAYLEAVGDGSGVFSIAPRSLLTMGGNAAFLSLTGDPWRLLTSMFLHLNLVHLLFNMALLYWLGHLLEYSMGRAHMLSIFLAGGLWASWFSACWASVGTFDAAGHLKLIVSVGASGAVMALLAALLVELSLGEPGQHASLGDEPDKLRSELSKLLALNLVVGLFTPGVDQAAHVGGLVAGGAMAVSMWLLNEKPWLQRKPWRLPGAVSAGAVMLLAAVLLFSPWPRLYALRVDWDDEREVQRAHQRAQQRAMKETIDSAGRAKDAQRDRQNMAKRLERGLPKPVSDAVAEGRILRTEDAETIDRLMAEFGIEFRSTPSALERSLQTTRLALTFRRRAPDGFQMTDAGGVLALVPSAKGGEEPSNDILQGWELCSARYGGYQFRPFAAFSDGKQRNWIASANHYLVRVTDLASGANVAVFPVGGQPIDMNFDASGERILVLYDGRKASQGNESREEEMAAVLDLKHRMRVEPDTPAADPMICGWIP